MAIFQQGPPTGGVECRVYETIAISDQYLGLSRKWNKIGEELLLNVNRKRSNGTVFNDLAWPDLKSRYYLT